MILNHVLRCFLCLLIVGPLASSSKVFAQDEFDGIDLSDNEQNENIEQDLEAPSSTSKPSTQEIDTAFGEDDEPQLSEVDVERKISKNDRVKSIQKKLYLKRGRFELAPYVTINVNDPFYTRLGGAIRAAIYPHDTIAISARFTLMATLPTEDVRTAKRNLHSRIFYSVPIWTAMADVEWSPLYGKVAIFNSILHFDGYILAGGGVCFTETSASSDPNQAGMKPAFDLGLGLRFITKDWLAVNVALINTTYVDVPSGSTKGTAQNIASIHAGLSIFFPLRSTYREAE